MKRQLNFIITFIIVINSIAWSQSPLSNKYPFGLPLRSYSGTALSMGGVSVGVPNDHHVMLTNPGNLGTIDKMSFSSLLMIDYLRVNDNEQYSDHIKISPRQISLAFPLSFLGTIAFSLSKDTDASLRFRSLIDNFGVDSINIHNMGGISKWQAGWGYSIGKWINIGIAYERTNLRIQNYRQTVFNESELVEDSVSILFKGNGIRLGVLGIYKDLSVGISGSYIFKDKLEYDSTFTTTVPNNQTSYNYLNSCKIHPPPSLSFGVGYNISPKWLIGSDLSIDLWQEYYIEDQDVLAQIDPKNTVSFSLGTRFIPAPKILAPKYWETIHYRTGLRYTQLPGNNSYEAALSIGFGLPLKGNGLFDLAFDVGRRNTDISNDYNETFLQVGIGINGGRKWHKSSTTTY